MNEKKKRPLGLFTGTNIRELTFQHPDLPIVFLVDVCDFTGEYDSEYASSAIGEIGEILDCEQDIDECRCFHDRETFEEELYDKIRIEADDDTPQEEVEAECKRQLAEYEPYWKKCIIVRVGN